MVGKRSKPSVAEAGTTPPAPSDGDLMAVYVEDSAGDPAGFLIRWQHLEDGWLYAEDTDNYVSLDASL